MFREGTSERDWREIEAKSTKTYAVPFEKYSEKDFLKPLML